MTLKISFQISWSSSTYASPYDEQDVPESRRSSSCMRLSEQASTSLEAKSYAPVPFAVCGSRSVCTYVQDEIISVTLLRERADGFSFTCI